MRGIHPPKRHSCLHFSLLVLIRGKILHSLRLIVAEHRANHRRLHAKLHLIILALALLDFDTLLKYYKRNGLYLDICGIIPLNIALG